MPAEMIVMDIDISFARVLDVGYYCIVIGARSFHQELDIVIIMAEGFIKGYECCGNENNR